MGKSNTEVKAASMNNKTSTSAQKPKEGGYCDRFRKLSELAAVVNFPCESKNIDLCSIMTDSAEFAPINTALNNSLNAIGLGKTEDIKNFVKWFCIRNFKYSVSTFLFESKLQINITQDILKNLENHMPLSIALSAFESFKRVKDPKQEGLLTITDKRIKDYLHTMDGADV